VEKANEKVVVLCRNASSLLGFSRTLNDLGYYSVSLCGSIEQLVELLEAGKTYRYLVFDDFKLGVDAQPLEDIAWYRAIASMIIVADANSTQRQRVFHWARAREIPLLGVLQAPLRIAELGALMGCCGALEGERGQVWQKCVGGVRNPLPEGRGNCPESLEHSESS